MSKHVAFKRIIRFSLLTTAFISCSAYASYYQQFYQDTRGLGTANAGAAADAQDAAVQYTNPAGLTKLKRQQVIAGGIFGIASAEFNGQHTYSFQGIPFSQTGKAISNMNGILPTFFYGLPINDRLAFGFSVASPFSGVLDFPTTAANRYSGTYSEYVTADLSPSVAYKVNDKLSVGLGLDAQYFHSKIDYAVNLITTDGTLSTTAKDWRYGFHTGLHYDITPATRAGVSFRSQIIHHPEGTASVSSVYGNFASNNFGYDLVSPATTNLSVSHDVNQQLTVMASADYSYWKTLKQYVFRNLVTPTGQQITTVQPENFKNTWRLALGTAYKLNPKVTLRAGLAYDQSPIPNVNRFSQQPDNDAKQVSVGVHYQATKMVGLDAGYTHIFIKQTDINYNNPPNAQIGTAGARGDLLGLQAIWTI